VNIADDVLKEFMEWFETQLAADPDLHVTADLLIVAAERKGKRCLDDLLNVPRTNLCLREWISTNLEATEVEFRDVRRVGGDHDRGFTSTLNRETRKRRSGDG